MDRTTDVLLFLILLVNLLVYYELIYGADAPESPPLVIYGIAATGVIVLLWSLVQDFTTE